MTNNKRFTVIEDISEGCLWKTTEDFSTVLSNIYGPGQFGDNERGYGNEWVFRDKITKCKLHFYTREGVGRIGGNHSIADNIYEAFYSHLKDLFLSNKKIRN